MKQVVLSIALFFMLSCQKKTPYQKHTVQVSTIVDLTDPQGVMPDVEYIISLFGLSEDIDKEVYFRLLPTTDKVLNPVQTLHLEDGKTTEKDNKRDIPLYREKLIRQFYQNTRKTIEDWNASRTLDTPLAHSECFATIAKELTQLRSIGANKSILLIYSDLQENSNLFSTYTAEGKAILVNEPDRFSGIFASSKLMPDDLTGINIVFIYNPKSREDDISYRKMIEIYTHILEPRGATCEVRANN